MNRFFIAVIACCILVVGIPQQTVPVNTQEGYRKLYEDADRLYRNAESLSGTKGFSDEEEEAMNQQALTAFNRVTVLMKSSGVRDDSLSFFCYLKTGILEHYFGNIPAAQTAYSRCIGIKASLSNLADSFLFKPYLYAGSIYYLQDKFDSAFQFYKKAEQVINQYPVPIAETERLYNTFGTLYLSSGNYRQAKNYFEKAISILSPSHPYYQALLANYKINIAGALIQLEEYKTADSIYQTLLPLHINTNEIEHNLGLISLYTGEYRKAIARFRKANYTGSQQVALDNAIARAYLQLGQYDSATHYLQRATAANRAFNGSRKNNDHGTTLKLGGDLEAAKKNYPEAVIKYQQAIIQFDPAFDDFRADKSPGEFSGVFSYIDLLNALTTKAEAWRQMDTTTKNTAELLAALDAYRSAYALIAYVEKTYDSDEARLFLNRAKYSIRRAPIEICLQLRERTDEKKYLEDAYLFDQRNKATILALNVQENIFKRAAEKGSDIFSRQTAIRSAITRLSLKAQQSVDSAEAARISAAIRDQEIRLSKIQDTINTDPAFSRFRAVENIPSIADVQDKILDKKTALLSYQLSADRLFVFCVTKTSFTCEQQVIDSSFFSKLDQFVHAIHDVSGEQKFAGISNSISLYQSLLLPVQPLLQGIDRLIIIPDDELNYLPFEALQDERKEWLVHSYAIQYQYSTALLGSGYGETHSNNEFLGLAPFAHPHYLPGAASSRFEALQYSLAEINNLAGKILADSEATKSAFLQNANHYGIIHLATHASANDQAPASSFIAFYPGSKDNLLYAQEIYDLNLDSTRLIILSACETGSGVLIKGEGMMSLSRAFAYAGCPNIITSLWKAEDQTTAFIAQQLHRYLGKGYTRDKALQQAKIDLLLSDKIEQRFKTPNYWAQLVLIDNYEPGKKTSKSGWLILAIVVGIGTAFFVFYKQKSLASSKPGSLHS